MYLFVNYFCLENKSEKDIFLNVSFVRISKQESANKETPLTKAPCLNDNLLKKKITYQQVVCCTYNYYCMPLISRLCLMLECNDLNKLKQNKSKMTIICFSSTNSTYFNIIF